LIYRPGFNYKKAGVIVMEITPESQLQSSLFDTRERGKERDLMEAMDKLTARFGRDTVKIAAQGFSKRWKLKQESLSPCYTTRFDELLTIKI
jgi:DNA polymerase V